MLHGEQNVLIGHEAGAMLTGASQNAFFGAGAGRHTETTMHNTFLGFNSGFSNISGDENTCVGANAGSGGTEGSQNVFIGSNTGSGCNGSGNVMIGTWAGVENNGSGNVFIGHTAGHSMMWGSNLLVIDNENRNGQESLIYGRFDQDKLRLNAFVGVNMKPDSAFSLKAAGDIQANEVTAVSDGRFKSDIHQIRDALDLVLSMDGITYRWDETAMRGRGFKEGIHLGFIAQDMEKVVPELVATDSEGYKSVNYQKVSTILVEAMKEQQQMIRERDQKIQSLESRVERMEEIVSGLVD